MTGVLELVLAFLLSLGGLFPSAGSSASASGGPITIQSHDPLPPPPPPDTGGDE